MDGVRALTPAGSKLWDEPCPSHDTQETLFGACIAVNASVTAPAPRHIAKLHRGTQFCQRDPVAPLRLPAIAPSFPRSTVPS